MTGGTGFIGSHLVEHLLKQGFDVRCIVRSSRSKLGWIEGLPVEIVKADLTSANSLRTALHDAEYVFHIAGTTKVRRMEEYRIGNVDITKALLEASISNSRIKKFCHMSTLSTVGPSYDGQPVDETTPYGPISEYGVTKVEAERLVQNAAEQMPVVILRPPTVYGPRDTDVFEMFQWVRRGIMPAIGNKPKKLSMIHAQDLARGITEATLSDKTTGNTYFISNEPVYEYLDIVKLLAEIQGVKNARMIPFPAFALFTIAAFTQLGSKFSSRPNILNLNKAREILEPYWICSPQQIKNDIGFESRISIEEGLRNTYEWYKAQKWL